MARGGHVTDDADLNQNGIADDIEEMFCDAIYGCSTEKLDELEQIEFSRLLEYACEISKFAVKDHLFTVYDVLSEVNLFETCIVAVEGTDLDKHMQVLLASKWSIPTMAEELLQTRHVDMITASHYYAKDRLTWCDAMTKKYHSNKGSMSTMLNGYRCIVETILAKGDKKRITSFSEGVLTKVISDFSNDGSQIRQKTMKGGSGKAYAKVWLKMYSTTQDEILAYAASRNDARIVTTLKEYGFGSVILDALIRVEMHDVFERAVDIIEKRGRELGVSEEDAHKLLSYLHKVNDEVRFLEPHWSKSHQALQSYSDNNKNPGLVSLVAVESYVEERHGSYALQFRSRD